MNTLYYGDCLTIMREKMSPASVDLVYLDPPFNSKRDYNAIYKDRTGRPLPDQIEAFNDTWLLDAEKMRVIREMPTLLREHGIDGHSADFLAGFISGLVHTQADMAAYLAYMTERLLWIRRVMKPTASVYLHCDPTASHYLKVMMDVVFGKKNFRNEVVWHYYNKYSAGKKVFGRNYDQLLFYGKTNSAYFSPIREPREKPVRQLVRENVDGVLKNKRDKDGNIMYRVSTDKKVDAVWSIPCLQPAAKEYLRFPTQKPVKLLDRVIRASCPPEGVVFDPFCGCATTIEAASKLNRRWVGIDITIHAIRRVARARLQERLHLVEGQDYAIEGVPRDWEGARQLWRQDTYQFQKWCVEQVEGFVNVKKSADDGIDGRVYFDMPGEKILQSMALEVKGGENLSINSVRALNSVLQYENVQMAGLIALNAPGSQQARNFQRAMALAGHVKIGEREYPKIQMLTVDEILRGAKFDMPRPAGRTETAYDSDLFSAAPIE